MSHRPATFGMIGIVAAVVRSASFGIVAAVARSAPFGMIAVVGAFA